jgi:hypothetical protein
MDANGLQGVYNLAYVSVSSGAAVFSNAIYNPVPGNITSVSKTYNNFDSTGTQPIFDPNDPALNHGTFTIGYTFDPNAGPVFFGIRDMANGTGLGSPYTGMNYDNGTCTSNARKIDFTAIGCSYNAGNRTVNFADYTNLGQSAYTPSSSGANFTFGVRFDLGGTFPATGGSICNNADAVWIDYSTPGHPVRTAPSPNVCLKKVNAIYPKLESKYGNVYAGGGFELNASSPGAGCVDATGPNSVNTNPGSTSQYVVAARQGVTGLTSLSGQSAMNYAQVCRKDLYAALQRDSGNYDGLTSANITAGYSEPVNGKWRQGPPTGVHIGSINITRRWTLYVPGDVYIDGDITGNGLLGIVADNIYINPNAGNVTALLAAGSTVRGGGTINTCATTPGGGLVNTLSSGPAPLSADACAQNVLTVNGIMYGKHLKFNRTAPQGSSALSGPRESVQLPARLFTLIPPGFSTLGIGGGGTIFTGELPPRY